MPDYELSVNNVKRRVSVESNTPLLWVLRTELRLTGTRYSCGEGFCGSCTVLMNGEAVRSCVITVAEAAAQIWKVDSSECEAVKSTVLHRATGQQLPYGELVSLAATLPVDCVIANAAQCR